MAEEVRVRLAYGRQGLEVSFPRDRTTLVEPRHLPGVADEAAALRQALRQPIGTRPLVELVPPGAGVAIAVCDLTRPVPTRRILPVVLEELERARAGPVTIFVATGTHRANTPDELREMLGEAVLDRCRVVNHDAFDRSTLAYLGRSPAGGEIWLNREYLSSDVRLTIGFIEPHFFAGFSGGPKMIMPGLAGLDTVLHAHSARMIASPRATWGITEGNPIHDEIRAIAALARVDLALDVTINRERQITAVFAGEIFAAHAAGCRFARATAMAPVAEPFDVVVTTNSGYPLDLNLYQSVKGMCAAAEIVRPGGAIVVAAACSDGVPAHGSYRRLLGLADSPRALLDLISSPGFQEHDQWQVQRQALVQEKARVYMKADGVNADELRRAFLLPCDDVGAQVEALLAEYGPQARVAVLPEGPQTIPYLVAQAERI